MAFEFFDPGPLIDGDLELIVPEEKWIDEILRTCAHPVGRLDPSANITRQQIEDYLRAAPAGRYVPGPKEVRVPQYQFWMRLRDEFRPPVVIAGAIGLRIGDNEDLRMHLGHVGYNVYPAAQGHHYAARACKLLFPLARKHGLREIWITCNPENIASRRTCQFLGATFVGTVPLPKNHILYQRGERYKCRYRIDLNAQASRW